MGRLLESYRPELHYMRGPGPKWHAKHSELSAPAKVKTADLPLSIWLLPAATAALLGLVAVVALA